VRDKPGTFGGRVSVFLRRAPVNNGAFDIRATNPGNFLSLSADAVRRITGDPHPPARAQQPQQQLLIGPSIAGRVERISK